MSQNLIHFREVFDVWESTLLDFFPIGMEKKYILVVVNYVSKWVEAQALPPNDAQFVVKFLKKLFSCFGAPIANIKDRGTHCWHTQGSPPHIILKLVVKRR